MEEEKRKPAGPENPGKKPFEGIVEDIVPVPPRIEPWGKRPFGLGSSVAALLVVGVAVGAVAGIIGWRWYADQHRRLTISDALVKGETQALSPAIEGKISSISLQEGDRVKAGQAIASLQNEEVQAEVAKAQANARKMENQLKKAGTGLEDLRKRVPEELNKAAQALEASRSRLRAAESRLSHISREPDRGHVVYRSGPRERMKSQEVQGARRRAKAELDAAKKEVRRNESWQQTVRAKRNLMELKRRAVDAARTRRDQARSVLDGATQKLAATTLASPISGVVSKKGFNTGDLVKPGDIVAVVVDVDRLWIEALLDEARVKRVSVGQPVDVKVDGFPDKSFSGKIVGIGEAAASEVPSQSESHSTETAPKTLQGIPVKIEFDQPALQLRPGMKASVIIDTRRS